MYEGEVEKYFAESKVKARYKLGGSVPLVV